MMHDHDAPQPQNSPQQSLSLNPASGSHSQASPDNLKRAAPEVSDGHMHGIFSGSGMHDMHATPENFPQATDNTGTSDPQPDIEINSHNVPSPGSHRAPGQDTRFAGGAHPKHSGHCDFE